MPIIPIIYNQLPRVGSVTSYQTVPMPTQRQLAKREASPLDVVRRRVAHHPAMQDLLLVWIPLEQKFANDAAHRIEMGREAAACGFPLFLPSEEICNPKQVTTAVEAIDGGEQQKSL